MKKLKIYLDTSVISYLEQEDAPERMQETRDLWEKVVAGEYEIILSDIALMEVNNCPEPKRTKLQTYIKQIDYKNVCVTEESVRLAQKIIELGLLTKRSFDDCQHIALALMNECDCILSWNFKHIVNIKTIRGVRAISHFEGFKTVEIITPSVLLEREWIRFEEVRD